LSGHSKWSTIKHQKSTADQRRGKLFSKLSRAIAVAVKEGGGGDPEINSRLRMVIDQAREANMPNDNIKRAVEKGLGKGKGDGGLETVFYEGFGPAKVAVIIESVTDNKNRAVSQIKSLLEKAGGNLGSPGSASYLFTKKGLILVEKKDQAEEQILQLIDLGVDDVEEEENLVEVYSQPDQVEEIRDKIKEAGFKIKEVSLAFKAKTTIPLQKDKEKKEVIQLLQALEGLDDVQRVFCNANFIS